MIEPLTTITLADDTPAEIILLTAPEPDDPLRVRDLLGHKEGVYHDHINRALEEPLDALETRFYLAVVGGRAVANVMLVEHRGAGILGHVFTLPEWRRRGLCQAIFETMMPHFRARGGLRLILGTGYDSPAYWIYHRFGFRSLLANSGFMAYATRDDWREDWFAPDPVQVEPYAWHHGPTLAQLLGEGHGHGLQVVQLGAFGPSNFEGPSLHLQRQVEQGQAQVRVLTTPRGAAVGLAILAADRRWAGRVDLLDCLIHPAFEEHLPLLLADLPWPAEDRRIHAYVPAIDAVRQEALSSFGFTEQARLAGLVDTGEVVVMAR